MTAKKDAKRSAGDAGIAPLARGALAGRRLARAKRRRQGLRIVHRYTVLSAGLGLIPARPLMQVAISGLLIKLVRDLGALYEVNVSDHIAKTAIATVLGGAHSGWIGTYLIHKLERFAPGAVGGVQLVVGPAASAAVTYGLGMLFLHHFATGAWSKTKP
ncbi:MAG: hypothetical protein U1E83_03140 [Methylotetracoccus sp.]